MWLRWTRKAIGVLVLRWIFWKLQEIHCARNSSLAHFPILLLSLTLCRSENIGRNSRVSFVCVDERRGEVWKRGVRALVKVNKNLSELVAWAQRGKSSPSGKHYIATKAFCYMFLKYINKIIESKTTYRFIFTTLAEIYWKHIRSEYTGMKLD